MIEVWTAVHSNISMEFVAGKRPRFTFYDCMNPFKSTWHVCRPLLFAPKLQTIFVTKLRFKPSRFWWWGCYSNGTRIARIGYHEPWEP